MNTIMRYLFIIKFLFFFVLFQEVIVFNNKVIAEQFELKKLSESESPSRKEADLRGAIDNEQNSTKNDKEKESSKQKVDDSSNDYQLSRAFDLILALDLANNN